MIRILFISILALVQISGQTVDQTFDPRAQPFGGLHQQHQQHLHQQQQHRGQPRPPPFPPGTGGAGVPPPIRQLHPQFAQHPGARPQGVNGQRHRRSIPVGSPPVGSIGQGRPVGPIGHTHPRESQVFYPHNGPAMMHFDRPAHPEGVQNHRHRRAVPAEGPATVPFRAGGHPQVQHFHVQQQHQATLRQAALRRGGGGGRHVRSVPSDAVVQPQQHFDERLGQRPLPNRPPRGPVPLAGAGQQPHQLRNGPQRFVPASLQQQPMKPGFGHPGVPIQNHAGNQGAFRPGQTKQFHPAQHRNVPFVAGNYDPDQHSTTTTPKPATTTAKPASKSNSWF